MLQTWIIVLRFTGSSHFGSRACWVWGLGFGGLGFNIVPGLLSHARTLIAGLHPSMAPSPGALLQYIAAWLTIWERVPHISDREAGNGCEERELCRLAAIGRRERRHLTWWLTRGISRSLPNSSGSHAGAGLFLRFAGASVVDAYSSGNAPTGRPRHPGKPCTGADGPCVANALAKLGTPGHLTAQATVGNDPRFPAVVLLAVPLGLRLLSAGCFVRSLDALAVILPALAVGPMMPACGLTLTRTWRGPWLARCRGHGRRPSSAFDVWFVA